MTEDMEDKLKKSKMQRKWHRLVFDNPGLEVLGEIMCDEYCRYPRSYDEEAEGISLAESDICKECPLGGWQ